MLHQYVWPCLYHHMDQYVISCAACQKNKASHQKKMGTAQLPKIPLDPWERMSIDFCVPFPSSKNGNVSIGNFSVNLCVREAIKSYPARRQSPLREQSSYSSIVSCPEQDYHRPSTQTEVHSLCPVSGNTYGRPWGLRWLFQPLITPTLTPM